MRVSRMIATLAITGAGVFAFAAPAAAGENSTAPSVPHAVTPSHQPVATTLDDNNCYGGYTADGGAMACFIPYGEHLWLCDTAADGHHPGVWYSINGGSWVKKDYDLRAGNCKDINLEIAESGYIRFYAVNFEGSTALSYSDVYRVSAYG